MSQENFLQKLFILFTIFWKHFNFKAFRFFWGQSPNELQNFTFFLDY